MTDEALMQQAGLDPEDESRVTERRLREVREMKADLEDAIEMAELMHEEKFQNYLKTLRGHWVNRAVVALNMMNSEDVRKEFAVRADEVKILISAIEKKPMQIKDIAQFIEEEQERAKPSTEDFV